jgi:Contractile injection system tube protein/LysM domain
MALEKAQIIIMHTGEKIPVMFNPEEYTVNKDNNFASQAVPGLSGPVLQFVNGNMRTLEMELFFDTYEQHRDVRDETEKVVNLLKIDSTLHAPPVLQVTWASLNLTCVLARVSQKFILFFEDGKPARARLTVTFNEFIDPELEAKEVNRQTADFSKVHIIIQGETLSGIAAELYNDPQSWRPIALANGIADPRAITPGLQLLVPTLPYNDPETGEPVN